ncbi:MAG: disulfide bond formation protein B [Hoeflea sp.]|uniref:Disulfide bond formation protein B n=1 Tax=Hoeflea algicola TaxID=2983763 RepID=A0ABT3ZFU2_9HYPH|nr:disulfide bond formation protein B [Hoeflea algicola]MCY0150675.1 disulfide bond formation protein B [Hoeflea algicola]
MSINPEPQALSAEELPLLTAFIIALAATLGALFIGEVLGQMPCTLCWYQRIAMFPLVPIIGLSIWRSDGMARLYSPPLALAGLALAGWHSGLYAGWIPQVIAPCTKDGPSCSGPAQIILGLPIPYLSLIAFAAILACLVLSKGKRK